MADILATRDFSANLFLDETPEENLQKTGVNPRAGEFNLLERLDDDFVESNPVIRAALTEVQGEGYSVDPEKGDLWCS